MSEVVKKPGTLYLCATPIGNLEDITLRALRILKTVDYIAAEDTRHTLKLLNHFEISKPLISYHAHNQREREEEMIGLLRQGCSIALVSDAGMPGISDPGADLVAALHREGLVPTIVPGPSASLSALVLSGISTERFAFEGFLPKDKKLRMARICSLVPETRTLILYEAPHRLKTVLAELYAQFGKRRITIVRELTKVYEQVLPMDLASAVAYYDENAPRGEFVLVLEGAPNCEERIDYSNLSIPEHLKAYIQAGMDKREAIKQVAKDRGVPKNEVYQWAIGIEE